jgi:hypothetical protein
MPVLDPNVKDLYFRHRWNGEQFAAGMRQLKEVVSNLLSASPLSYVLTLV